MASKRVSRWERNAEVQAALDAQHRAEHYTGGAYSIMTGDWTVWVKGEIRGCAPSAQEAYRQALGPEGLALSPRGG